MMGFQLIQKNFAAVGISRNLVDQPYPSPIWKILLGFVVLVSFFICNLMYIFREAKTFTDYNQSMYMGSFTVGIIFGLIILLLNEMQLFNLINGFDNIANTPLKYSASRAIFNETNQLVEQMTEIIFNVIVKVTVLFSYVPSTIYIYFIYFTSDLGNAAFEIPGPLWMPFDWRNPFGFFIATILHSIAVSYHLMIYACVTSFGFGCYSFIIAASKSIRGSLFSISQNIHAKMNKRRLLDQFVEFFEFHSTTKRLVTDSSDIFKNINTLAFIWSLVTICGALLMIQTQILNHSDDSEIILITTMQILYAFGVMFIACELCQRVNISFDECYEIIGQFDWYLLPVEIQRMLPLVNIFSQQSVDIQCFGSADCDRETFKYMIKTAYSYFTVLRQFIE